MTGYCFFGGHWSEVLNAATMSCTECEARRMQALLGTAGVSNWWEEATACTQHLASA